MTLRSLSLYKSVLQLTESMSLLFLYTNVRYSIEVWVGIFLATSRLMPISVAHGSECKAEKLGVTFSCIHWTGKVSRRNFVGETDCAKLKSLVHLRFAPMGWRKWHFFCKKIAKSSWRSWASADFFPGEGKIFQGGQKHNICLKNT